MSYISSSYTNNNQKTLNSYVDHTDTQKVDKSYVERQKNILTQQKQNQLGTIPRGIKRFSHTDSIQNTLYGVNNQDIELSSDVNIDEYKKYDQYYDYLNKNGLLKENVKYKLNTIQLNIDSSHRNILPLVMYEKEILLPNNPLHFDSSTTLSGLDTNKSNLFVINCPGHNLAKGDRFSLGGIKNEIVNLNSIFTDINNKKTYAVTFTKNSKAVSFLCSYDINTGTSNTNNIDVHFSMGPISNYLPKYKIDILSNYDTSNLKVKISGFGIQGLDPFVGNIPVNFLNGTHRIYFINPDPDYISDGSTATEFESKEINVPTTDGNVKINGFYILLDTPYAGSNVVTNFTLSLEFNHYGGIPLNQLNAEFPINYNSAFGYHEVFDTTSTHIITKIKNDAYYDDPNIENTRLSFGGNAVYLSKITNLIYGYSSPSQYIIKLPKSMHNVISAKLVSTTFPNTSKIIRNTPENNNNMLYWQNQDDGDYIYSIALDAGNYSPESLKTAIEQKIYKVKRDKEVIPDTGTENVKYTDTNFMSVTIDTDTNTVTFKSYKEVLLIKPIIKIDPSINDTDIQAYTYTITINQPHHNLSIGDSVLLSGFITTMGIPETVLNTTHIVTDVKDDTYSFEIKNFNLYNGSRVKTDGGYSAKAYIPNSFRLLFNTSDTCGELLGFRNVGDDTSITKFGTEIKNSDLYENEVTTTDIEGNIYVYNKSGNSSLLTSNNIKLSGYDYVLMSIEELNSSINIGVNSVRNFFAKINLGGLPGKILYDTFVPTEIAMFDPINIDKLTIKFYAPDGTLFDFNGVNHSFVINMITQDYETIDAGIVSNKTIF